MARKLEVQIVGDASSLDRAYRHATRATQKFSVGLGTIVKSAVVWDTVQAGIRGVTGAVGASVDEFVQQQQVAAQTTAVLKSTGGAANVTARQVDRLATSISSYSGIDDEAVQAGENMLLTFTHVQNAVGAGNDIFNQATGTIADLATAMNKGAAPSMDQMSTAALQVGKALNDPVRGYARLQRIGVAFTAAQVQQIKGFAKVGDTLGAQRVILGELTREFGDSAREMGKSIPGELNRVRESFRNLGGSIVSSVAPALSTALESVNRFVTRLSAARGVHAKLNVVWDGIRQAAASAADQLRDAFNRINWDQVWTDTQRIARSLLDRLVAAFTAIDFARVGATVGGKLAALVGPVTEFVKGIDWQKVGKAVIDGLLIALGGLTVAAGKFFEKAFPALVRLWIAEIKAMGNLLLGVGKAIVDPILDAIGGALDAAGRFLESKAIQIVLKIIEPFTHIPGGIPGLGKVGSLTRDLKTSLQATLTELGKTTASHASTVGVTIGTSLTAGIKTGVEQTGPSAADAIRDAADRTRPPVPAAAAPAAAGGGPRGVTASQRNSWFDDMINRALDRVQDIPTLKGQIARLKEISGLVQQRRAATTDITRRLTLEDKNLQILRQIRADQADLKDKADTAQKARDEKQKAADEKEKAAAKAATQRAAERIAAINQAAILQTKEIDAMNALAKKEQAADAARAKKQQAADAAAAKRAAQHAADRVAAINKAARLHPQAVTAAQDALVKSQRQADATRRERRQYQELGLTATGEERAPGVRALQRRLAKLGKQVPATLARGIAKVLADGVNGVNRQMKLTIAGLLDQYDKLDKKTDTTLRHFHRLSASTIANQLGGNLTATQKRRLEAGIATLGPGLTRAQGTPAFGGRHTVVVNGPMHFHGVQDIQGLENELHKRTKARTHPRRGTR